jgi:hypothetical protein
VLRSVPVHHSVYMLAQNGYGCRMFGITSLLVAALVTTTICNTLRSFLIMAGTLRFVILLRLLEIICDNYFAKIVKVCSVYVQQKYS